MYRIDTHAARGYAPARNLAPRPARYPSREFGMGYGSSSGYAAARRYTPGSQPAPRFRLG